jgi:hypothetical protein
VTDESIGVFEDDDLGDPTPPGGPVDDLTYEELAALAVPAADPSQPSPTEVN